MQLKEAPKEKDANQLQRKLQEEILRKEGLKIIISKQSNMQNQLNVDFNQTTAVICEECNGTYFDQALVLRKASGILTGQAKPTIIPIPVFKCTKCGHVNGEFLPQEIQALD